VLLQLGRHLPKRMIRPKSVITRCNGRELHRQLTPATTLNGRSMPVPFRQSGSITSIEPKVVYQ